MGICGEPGVYNSQNTWKRQNPKSYILILKDIPFAALNA